MSFHSTTPSTPSGNFVQRLQQQPYGYAYQPPEPEQAKPGLMDILSQSLGTGLGEGIAGGIRQQLKRSALDKMLSTVNPNMSPKERLLAIGSADAETQPLLQEYFKQEDAQRLAEQKQRAQQEQAQAFNQSLQGIYRQPQQQGQLQLEQPTAEGQPGQGIGVSSAVTDPNYQKILLQAAQHKADLDQKERHKNEEMDFKKKERQIASEDKRVSPILQEVDAARRTIDIRKSLLEQQRLAVQKGDIDSFKNYFAELTGAENLRSADGTIFKTAGKDLFLNSIQKVGARPNQWIEQQLADAQAKIGRSNEANLSTIAVQDFSLNVLDKETQLYQDLAEQFISDPNYGYVPSNINRIVNQSMKPYVQEQEKKLAYELREIHEQENPKELQRINKVPKGTPLTVEKMEVILNAVGGDEKKAERLAKDAGYDIYSAPTWRNK